MIKKILPISVFVLVLIIVILLGIQNMLGKNNSQGTASITPTLVQGREGGSSSSQTGKTGNTSTQQVTTDELQKTLPIIAPEFTLDYSHPMEKYVVSLKTDDGQTAYDQWLTQNQSFAPLLTPDQVIIAHQSVTELNQVVENTKELTPAEHAKIDSEKFMFVINSLMSLPYIIQNIGKPTPTPTKLPSVPKPTSKADNSTSSNSGSNSYTYYAQSGGAYDDYLLPIQNCPDGTPATEKKAGCGPTTAAMIISSYVDSTQTPPKVIEAMSKAGVSISCNGSGLYELYGYMSKVSGIKVSSILSLGHAEASAVADDFRNYIKGGWTLFVLADCKYGGHYFWVTDVSSDGEILAYDPAYGSGKPTPFNENLYDPYPYYIYAFAVKKS